MIPKVIHFIYPLTEKTRPWSIVNELAIKLARKHYPDYTINIWTNKIDFPLMGSVIIKHCELPMHIGGAEIVWPQYISDVMRLQILSEHGGVYMDTDILSLKPYNFASQEKLVLSWESSKFESISNAMMATPPNNLFIDQWLEKMPEAMESRTWAYGGVVLPRKLVMQPYLAYERIIHNHQWCCPLDLSKNWLFDPALKEEAKEKCKDSYAIHVFETYWRDVVKNIDEQWIKKYDCLFSELARL